MKLFEYSPIMFDYMLLIPHKYLVDSKDNDQKNNLINSNEILLLMIE